MDRSIYRSRSLRDMSKAYCSNLTRLHTVYIFDNTVRKIMAYTTTAKNPDIVRQRNSLQIIDGRSFLETAAV